MLMQAATVQITVLRRYDLIAFARSTLERRAIAQIDAASQPGEPAGPFQLRKRRRDAGASHAQDNREHIVGHRNDPIIQSVGREQQPSAQPFLEAVAGAAKRSLGVLDQQRVDIAEQLLLDVRVSVGDPAQVGRRDAQCISGDQHEASIGRTLYAEHRCHTNEPEPSDHRDLNRSVVLRPHQERCDTAFDEVDVLYGVMVVLKNCPTLERNGLQEREKPLEGRRRKASQQTVLDPDRLVAVGIAEPTLQRYPIELPRIRSGFVKLLSIRSHRNPTKGEAGLAMS
ncbi:hypothetical protein [Bradyrhizobium sp. NAS80.1]|uniref:hypothetical protein n=1 Tax=Bradyrhizobium sp. NAS80.1 TaxID=1680159 RepID=UPI001FD9B1FE|nr:hypothetical protein [Bradyrhizobium sp. NAS80.1]